jgi:hypothetical protein
MEVRTFPMRRLAVRGSGRHSSPEATGELQSALAQFVTFARSLKGDEKGEAQTFLDHFFRALGHKGVIEAGATFEFRVAKKPGSPQPFHIHSNI